MLSSGGQRRKEWKTIEKYLVLQMPELTFSNGVEACLSLIWFAVAVAVVIFILPKMYGPNPLGLYVDTGSWIGSILLTASEHSSSGRLHGRSYNRSQPSYPLIASLWEIW